MSKLPTPEKCAANIGKWITSASVARAARMIESCPCEVLGIVAAFLELAETTEQHAGEVAADGFVFTAEEVSSRAYLYRASAESLAKLWSE